MGQKSGGGWLLAEIFRVLEFEIFAISEFTNLKTCTHILTRLTPT